MTSKQFCLKWNNFQSNILLAFESLQNTEDLTDVTLTCEGVSLKAHKFILSACSPYFRAVFKENPCSHPIIILKDVSYADLIAVINFMYHGEVLVSEEQLASFLQTAKLLQVSGLNTTDEGVNKKSAKKKIKEVPERPVKKAKINKPKVTASDIEAPESSEEEFCGDVNENVEVVEKSDQGSILEAALEKSESILERSLTSAAGKSPSSLPFINEAKKPPELIKSSSSESSSPAFDRASEFLHQTIKIEEDNYENPETGEEGGVQISRTSDVQPHHSSQCGSCPHCGKVYSNQSSLKYHVRLVHSDLSNMYCCHLCPEAFSYREGYKKHMVEVHCIRN